MSYRLGNTLEDWHDDGMPWHSIPGMVWHSIPGMASDLVARYLCHR